MNKKFAFAAYIFAATLSFAQPHPWIARPENWYARPQHWPLFYLSGQYETYPSNLPHPDDPCFFDVSYTRVNLSVEMRCEAWDVRQHRRFGFMSGDDKQEFDYPFHEPML
jgi:hypothetical protein